MRASMQDQRIEIKVSKKKSILLFLGSIILTGASVWVLSIAEAQERYDPLVARVAGYAGSVFFAFCAISIFFKLFNRKPGLIIDKDGILDHSSAFSGHLITWDAITGLRVGQYKSTRFILIDLADPEAFISSMSGIKKALVQANHRMFDTPASIASTNLDCSFEELFHLISQRLHANRSASLSR